MLVYSNQQKISPQLLSLHFSQGLWNSSGKKRGQSIHPLKILVLKEPRVLKETTEPSQGHGKEGIFQEQRCSQDLCDSPIKGQTPGPSVQFPRHRCVHTTAWLPAQVLWATGVAQCQGACLACWVPLQHWKNKTTQILWQAVGASLGCLKYIILHTASTHPIVDRFIPCKTHTHTHTKSSSCLLWVFLRKTANSTRTRQTPSE